MKISKPIKTVALVIFIIQAIFLVLRLFNLTDWPWLWVWSPLWMSAATVVLFILMIIVILAQLAKKK